jgi:hypothetical protein
MNAEFHLFVTLLVELLEPVLALALVPGLVALQ